MTEPKQRPVNVPEEIQKVFIVLINELNTVMRVKPSLERARAVSKLSDSILNAGGTLIMLAQQGKASSGIVTPSKSN